MLLIAWVPAHLWTGEVAVHRRHAGSTARPTGNEVGRVTVGNTVNRSRLLEVHVRRSLLHVGRRPTRSASRNDGSRSMGRPALHWARHGPRLWNKLRMLPRRRHVCHLRAVDRMTSVLHGRGECHRTHKLWWHRTVGNALLAGHVHLLMREVLRLACESRVELRLTSKGHVHLLWWPTTMTRWTRVRNLRARVVRLHTSRRAVGRMHASRHHRHHAWLGWRTTRRLLLLWLWWLLLLRRTTEALIGLCHSGSRN